jgi:hypothetical protein
MEDREVLHFYLRKLALKRTVLAENRTEIALKRTVLEIKRCVFYVNLGFSITPVMLFRVEAVSAN